MSVPTHPSLTIEEMNELAPRLVGLDKFNLNRFSRMVPEPDKEIGWRVKMLMQLAEELRIKELEQKRAQGKEGAPPSATLTALFKQLDFETRRDPRLAPVLFHARIEYALQMLSLREASDPDLEEAQIIY